MKTSFGRVATIIVIVLFAAFVGERYILDFVLATGAPRTVTPRADLTAAEQSAIALFNQVSPSVVQVVGVQAGGQSDDGTQAIQSGSGFFWDAAGHVVTNNHVVENTSSLTVRLASGDSTVAHVVGRTPIYDLAVLSLERTTNLPPPVALGSSGNLQVGQAAYAIGNPFGLDESLTHGIVSALKRRLPTSGGREIADAIQTDAPINPGNSGGPLLDSAGRLIGVDTAIFSPSGANAGVGFAIPVDVVNRIVPELIANGRVPTPGIGILAADESIAARLGVQGVIVARTLPGMPAQSAGLHGFDPSTNTFDVITAANGHSVQRLADLTDQLDATGIGKSVTLTVKRGDQTLSFTVPVADVSQS